jgi:hypothetical protein
MSALSNKINLSLHEAVEYLREKGVRASYRSVKRWIRLGRLTVGRVNQYARFVTRESLDRMAAGESDE